MKKLSLIALFMLCYLWLQAQTITGKVYREGTFTAIPSATVYYGGTMTGTITDNDGRFALRAKAEQIPIVISCIGYYSSKIIYKPGQPLIVYLKPKEEQLKAVTIRADGMERSEEIALFLREFLGISDYARSCTITNIDDIDFLYTRKTETLYASCDKPLVIENKKLGYTINYYLDTFSRTPNFVYYAGNSIFKDKMPVAAKAQAEIKRNREDAYQYSRMQLIRVLWHRNLKKSGFRIYTSSYKPLTEDSLIVRDSINQQYLTVTGRVIIAQSRNVRGNLTSLTQIVRSSFIDKDGYYGAGLKWGGKLTLQRTGDLLPFEYQSEKELKDLYAKPDTNTIAAASADNTSLAALPTQTDVTILPYNKAWKQFASVVLMPNNELDTTRVVKKWQQPIRYKIYSSFNNKEYDKILTGYIEETLKKISAIASCDLSQTKDDRLVNLCIVIGRPTEFADVLPPEAVQYFNISGTNTCYYAATESGFTRMIACINPGHDFSLQDKMSVGKNKDMQGLWFQARQILMKSFGFAGSIDNARSLFDNDNNDWVPEDQINPPDIRIIQALYNPGVKSGMHEQEVYGAVKNMFIR